MRTPLVRDLPAPLADAARHVAERLRGAGLRGWIVGGAVRDLALGRTPREVDMASAATPQRIAELFASVVPVGISFGTVLVQERGIGIEHTTFRTEGAYRDARHPEEVHFGNSVEDDAARRDFTCNALFLDPLSDELVDPTGGLEDLSAGRLACVGDPMERFEEDALRLMRLARFAGALDLEVDAAHMAAARRAAPRLQRVAVERVLKELEQCCSKGGTARAFALLADASLLEHVLPSRAWAEGCAERLRTLRALEEPIQLAEALAVLLGTTAAAPEQVVAGDGSGARPGAGTADVERLRPSRDLLRRYVDLERLSREVDQLVELGGALPAHGVERSRVLRLLRHPVAASALRIARARRTAAGLDPGDVDRWERLRATLDPQLANPAPLLTSADLAERNIPRGPRWGSLLREAEDLQLQARLASREQALAWLAERAAEPFDGQDGGNTPRNA